MKIFQHTSFCSHPLLCSLNKVIFNTPKKNIKSFYFPLIALLISVSCIDKNPPDSPTTAEKPDCGEWNIAFHTWVGSLASASVFAEVAKAEYGCTIHLILYEDENEATYKALENGEIDLVLEDWGNGRWSPWTEKKAFKLVGFNGQEGRIGMYLPQWMADRYPDITESANLNKYAPLFKTTQSDSLGIWLEGPEEWTSIGNKLIQANQLNFKLVNLKTEKELIDAFNLADENQTAILGYWWTPHFLNAQRSLVRVNFPENDWSSSAQASGKTDYPSIKLMKLASNQLMESQSEIVNLITHFQWSNEDQNQVAAEIEKGTPPSQAAKIWINTNQEKVNTWLKTHN